MSSMYLNRILLNEQKSLLKMYFNLMSVVLYLKIHLTMGGLPLKLFLQVAAEHLNADGIIHFGHTCLTPSQVSSFFYVANNISCKSNRMSV